MDSRQQAATDLCAAINLTLGWRASDPEYDRVTGYTGNVVLHTRAADEIVKRIDSEGPTVWSPLIPVFKAGGADVIFAILLAAPVLGIDDIPAPYLSPTIHDIPACARRAPVRPSLRSQGVPAPRVPRRLS